LTNREGDGYSRRELSAGGQAVKKDQGLRAVAWATLLAAAAPVLAFDPALHQPSFEPHAFADYTPLLGIAPRDTIGLSVSGIADIGPQMRGPGPVEAPEDLWQRIRNGFAMPNLDSPLVVERQAWYADRPQQIGIMAEPMIPNASAMPSNKLQAFVEDIRRVPDYRFYMRINSDRLPGFSMDELPPNLNITRHLPQLD